MRFLNALLCAGALVASLATTAKAEGWQTPNWSAGSRVSTSTGIKSGYAAQLREYVSLSGQPLLNGCVTPANPQSSAAIAILFPGGPGTSEPGPEALDLAQALSFACVRLVYVKGTAAYDTNVDLGPVLTAEPRLAVQAEAMSQVMNAVMNRYPGAKRFYFIGGSNSAAIGAKVLEQKASLIAQSSGSNWSKLRRFIMAGSPIGNLVDGCYHSYDWGTLNQPAGLLMPIVTKNFIAMSDNLPGGYCNTLLNNRNGWSGAMYLPMSAAMQTSLVNANFRLNLFVGGDDDFFGAVTRPGIPSRMTAYSGPNGVDNYVATAFANSSNLVNTPWAQIPLNNYPASVDSANAFTKSVALGQGHSGVFNKFTNGVICTLAIYDGQASYPGITQPRLGPVYQTCRR
jgi:hypothetical protein